MLQTPKRLRINSYTSTTALIQSFAVSILPLALTFLLLPRLIRPGVMAASTKPAAYAAQLSSAVSGLVSTVISPQPVMFCVSSSVALAVQLATSLPWFYFCFEGVLGVPIFNLSLFIQRDVIRARTRQLAPVVCVNEHCGRGSRAMHEPVNNCTISNKKGIPSTLQWHGGCCCCFPALVAMRTFAVHTTCSWIGDGADAVTDTATPIVTRRTLKLMNPFCWV